MVISYLIATVRVLFKTQVLVAIFLYFQVETKIIITKNALHKYMVSIKEIFFGKLYIRKCNFELFYYLIKTKKCVTEKRTCVNKEYNLLNFLTSNGFVINAL